MRTMHFGIRFTLWTAVLVWAIASPFPGLAETHLAPQIDVWYGDEQRFGHLGNPQELINVLGSVTNSSQVTSLSYSLNGGPRQKLSMGCDKIRLARAGDFNIEIDPKMLRSGTNTVEIRASSQQGETVSRTIQVRYTMGNTWPLPFRIDWSKVEAIQDVAQVIDGKWSLDERGIRTAEPYYDRVVAIGDVTWKDYEVTTTVTYHKIMADERVSTAPFSDHAHASLILRWKGHPDDGKKPRVKWFPLGGLAMLQAGPDWEGSKWIWHGGESGPIAEEGKGRVIELGHPYNYKARVETWEYRKNRYSVKVWKHGEPEPDTWDLIVYDGRKDLKSGSLLLVAHHSDVTFGNVEVVPLPQ